MKSIYVATTGADAAAGTASAPLRTIAKALSKAAAGDKIIVRDGSYPEVVKITKASLQVVAENRGRAVIQGSASPANADLVTIAANGVLFDGFSVRDATRSGIAVWAATDVIVSNNLVTGSKRAGIWAGADALGKSTRLKITGNTVIGNCLENQARNWTGGWPRAIALDVSTAVTISGNTVGKNYGEGIGLQSTQDVQITGNTVFDNYSVEVYLDNAPASTVTKNLIFSSGDAGFYRDGKSAWGILVANEQTQFMLPSQGIKATGNTLMGADRATYVGPDTWSNTVVTACDFSLNAVFPAM